MAFVAQATKPAGALLRDRQAAADEAESMVPKIDPEQVRTLAGWGLTQNDRASFIRWSPQPSAVGPVPHQPGFLINLRP